VIGTVVIVGMTFATGIAIFLVPVLFVLVERLARRRQPAEAAAPSVPPPVSVPEHASS
jgi:hypothetical protein